MSGFICFILYYILIAMSSKTKQNLFFVFFSLLFFSTSLPYVYGSIGIDPSWTESLVMTINQDLVFGRDFIFNYGPLGYLNTSVLPKDVSPWLMFFLHLFLLGNNLAIIKLCFIRLGNDEWWKAAVVAVVIFLPWGFYSDTTFTYFYLMLFWLLYVNQTRNTLGLLIAIILAVLIFYIKVNLSLIAYGILALSLIYFSISGKITWRTTGVVLVLLSSLTYAFSVFLNVSLPDYLAAGLKIINAYQDGQAVNILRTKELLILLVFEGLIVVLVTVHLIKNFSLFSTHIYLYLLVAIAWFLCFKQAHTAVGYYNVFGFFLFLPVLSVLIFLFAEGFTGSGKLLVSVLVLQLLATQFIRISTSQNSFKNYFYAYLPDKIANEIKASKNPTKLFNILTTKNPVNYFHTLFSYDYSENFTNKDINELRVFPEKIQTIIGQKTVDIMPWEVSYVFFNRFNYNPRPVIQTYQANSDWLAKVNEIKYTSPGAPDFVFANVHDYREQNPIWMDKGAYLALRENYMLRDTLVMPEETFFLFEKQKAEPIPYEKGETFSGSIGQEITVPQNGTVFLHADIRYSIWGKLVRLLFQPPYLRSTVTYDDGSQESFRIPPPILKGGILVSEHVMNNDDFARFALKQTGNKKPIAIKFWANYSWGLEKDFDYHFETVK
jgi:hypothetical protein